MKKVVVGSLVVGMLALVALAERPVTTVTPENAGEQDVEFSVGIVPDQRGDLARISLKVTPKSAKYGKVGQPGLYVYKGETLVGLVAFFALEGKKGEAPTYWCDLAMDYVAGSRITVPCHSATPDESKDPDTQSREYVLPLKNYLKKEDAPKKPEEGK